MNHAERDEHLRRLGRALDETVALLDRMHEHRWGPWLRARRAGLAVDPDRTVAALRRSPGLDALTLDPAIGHELDDDDVRALNERLDRLRAVIGAEAHAWEAGA